MIKMVSNATETSIEDVAEATPETQVQVQAAAEAKVAKRSANGPGKKIRNMFSRLVKENKLDEATVANLQDETFTKEHLGKIKDIMLDIRQGKIEYYVIEFGGFLGIGEKFFAIPSRLLEIDTEEKVFRFNESKETLSKAPGFDKHHWPETNEHKTAYVTYSYSFGIIRMASVVTTDDY